MQISRFMADLNAGFKLLNLKNDSLRKRFDGLKYDIKKIEEIVYDISIRGLRPTPAWFHIPIHSDCITFFIAFFLLIRIKDLIQMIKNKKIKQQQ